MVVEKEIFGMVLGKNLKEPTGLAVDRQGTLYVTDNGNDRLITFNSELVPVREVGGQGSQAGELRRPGFVTVDNNLNVFVADEGNRRLSRFDARLNFVDDFSLSNSSDPLSVGEPSGIAITEYGKVWIADRRNNRIALFNSGGAFDRFIGEFGYSGGQLNAPEKLLRDAQDNMIVSDAGNHRLVVYDGYGNFERDIVEHGDDILFQRPVAATFDKSGLLWVVDAQKATIMVLSNKGVKIFEAGPLFTGITSPVRNPSDIVFLSADQLALSDRGNNRVLIMRLIRSPQGE